MFYFPSYPALIYAILYSISFWCWFLFEMWVFWRDRRLAQQSPRGGSRWYALIVVITITVAVNLAVLAPQFAIRAGFELFFVLALALIWGGLLLRFTAIQTLGSFFSTRLVIQQQHELITRGPYQRLRNPSYTGALVTFTGIGLGTGNWLSLAVLFLAMLAVYVLRIRIEDRLLSGAFGSAYEEYTLRSWALVPFIW